MCESNNSISNNEFQVDKVVPLFTKGLHTAQNVEFWAFFFNAFFEDCSFECNGTKFLAPKHGHVPSNNGKSTFL